jgi:hypothetical protein
MDAKGGHVQVGLGFKIKFTGTWLAPTEVCQTNAFGVLMDTNGNTDPNTNSMGIAYSSTTGEFEANTAGFNIAAFPGGQCLTHGGALSTNLSVGGAMNKSSMQIYWLFGEIGAAKPGDACMMQRAAHAAS